MSRQSTEYANALAALPEINHQGHGVRAFIEIALHTMVGPQPVLLIDEPEAHLHPPQARVLARKLISLAGSKQVLMATHSSTFLVGLLENEKEPISVVRLTRPKSGPSQYHLLSNDKLRELWANPLLRYSDILEGIFHEAVIVCEAESDCRFYAWVLEQLVTDATKSTRLDILFVHCGGKDRIETAVKALRAVGVPVAAIADIDMLNDVAKLEKLFNSLGGLWTEGHRTAWNSVNQAVAESLVPQAGDVKKNLSEILSKIPSAGPFPFEISEKIQSALPKKSPWENLKRNGIRGMKSGEPTRQLKAMISTYAEQGLFLVPEGEVEAFARSAGGPWPDMGEQRARHNRPRKR